MKLAAPQVTAILQIRLFVAIMVVLAISILPAVVRTAVMEDFTAI